MFPIWFGGGISVPMVEIINFEITKGDGVFFMMCELSLSTLDIELTSKRG